MKKLAMILILLLAPATSFADEPFYRSGNLYTSYDLVHFKDFGGGGDGGGFAFQAGYDITSWLALEGHIGMSNDIKQYLTDGTDYVKTRVRATYGSLVGRINLRFNRTTVFAYAGTTYLQENGSVSAWIGGTSYYASFNDNDTGATYGVGVALFGSENAALTFKAARIYKAKNNTTTIPTSVDTVTIGITYYAH